MIEKNIYQKLKTACEEAGYVKKGEKKAGMPFNHLLADEVKKVAMESLLKNGLYPVCNYTTDVRESFLIIHCDMKIFNVDNPSEYIEINGSSGFGKLDRYGSGHGMTYSQKYAFLSALNLITGINDEDGYEAEPFKKSEPQKPKLSLVNVDKSFADEWIDKMQQQGKNSTSPSQFEKDMQPLRSSYEQELQQIGKDLALQKKIDDAEIKIKQQITFRSE